MSNPRKRTAASREHRRAARRFGPLLLTTCRQPDSAPRLDGGRSGDAEGRTYGCLVLLVSRRSGEAVVLGWRDALTPNPTWWRKLAVLRLRQGIAHPVARRLLGPAVGGSCALCGAPLTGLPLPGWHDEGDPMGACYACAPTEADFGTAAGHPAGSALPPSWGDAAWQSFQDQDPEAGS